MKRTARNHYQDDLTIHELSASASNEFLRFGFASDVLPKNRSFSPFENPEHLDLACSQVSALRSRSTISFALQQSDEKIRLLKEGISRFSDQVHRQSPHTPYDKKARLLTR
jgi:hypothetical protein